MTLMKFSPETVRLRRVAKAYAAGEFSRSEYRATRREVIANFRADASSDDDTQRRDAVTVGSGAAVDPDQPRGRSATWLVMVALTMMVLGLVALEARAGTVIGAVSERSSDPMSSPRLDLRTLSSALASAGVTARNVW